MSREDFIIANFAYDPETGEVSRQGAPIRARHSGGYIAANVQGTAMLCHRIAWFLFYGRWPDHHIDHANGDRRDNRIANLREATVSQNLGNSRKRTDNKSGYKGVHWNKINKNWQAQICIGGRSTYLGSFADPRAAHAAYLSAAQRTFGEFARAA